MSDYLQELQQLAEGYGIWGMAARARVLREAISEIDRLRAENAELRAATGEPSWRYSVNGMRQAADIAAGCTTGDAAAKTIRREALRIESMRELYP